MDPILRSLRNGARKGSFPSQRLDFSPCDDLEGIWAALGSFFSLGITFSTEKSLATL